MNRFCIYLRKSRADAEAEARGEGETLARHEHTLLELSKKMKLPIMSIYKEVVSGETISARPVMQQLLSEVEQGLWDGVLVMEVERLARGDTIDQGIVAQTFKYSNTKIITPMKIYDPNNEYDEEYFEFGLFMSRREYKTINRRLQQGRITSVKEGKYVGNKTPYGYVRKKLDKEKGYTLEINPEQADVVRMIFELYAKGEQQPNGTYKRFGSDLIARKLNDLKICSANGNKWTPSTVLDMLRNPVYIGKIRWNWRPAIKKVVNGQIKIERPRAQPGDWILTDGLHKSIVDTETWNTVQEYMEKNPPRPCPRKQTIKNPLSGLIICGMCGRRMVRRPSNDRFPEMLMCPSPACKNIGSKLVYVEERLMQSLEKWLYNYKIDWNISNEKSLSQSKSLSIKKRAIKKLDDELNTLETQMNNIHDLLEQGVYTTNKFLERSRIISDKMNKAQTDRSNLVEQVQYEESREKNKKLVIPKIEKIIELYNAADDPSIKNELLKEILEKATYTKTVNGRWHNKPDDFELVIYPKIVK